MGFKKPTTKYSVNIIPTGTKTIEEVMRENRDWFEKIIMRHFKELKQNEQGNIGNKMVRDTRSNYESAI